MRFCFNSNNVLQGKTTAERANVVSSRGRGNLRRSDFSSYVADPSSSTARPSGSAVGTRMCQAQIWTCRPGVCNEMIRRQKLFSLTGKSSQEPPRTFKSIHAEHGFPASDARLCSWILRSRAVKRRSVVMVLIWGVLLAVDGRVVVAGRFRITTSAPGFT